MDIGQRIRFFREKRGITVNKLATLAGVSQSYLRDVELGNKQPTVEYLEYICDALGITLAAFFEPEPTDKVRTALNNLSEKQLNLLLDFLDSLRTE